MLPGSELFELVIALLRQRFSPEQIAGKLRSMSIPRFEDAYVCRETIYVGADGKLTHPAD
ncbi:hypothetical protein GCM10008969_04720 [Pseudomonas veronii subsp. inensis]